MEQFEKEPFFEETFRYKDLLWMGLWKELGFMTKAAVEVKLSGKNTEDIQARIGIIYFIMLYILFLIPNAEKTAETTLFISI